MASPLSIDSISSGDGPVNPPHHHHAPAGEQTAIAVEQNPTPTQKGSTDFRNQSNVDKEVPHVRFASTSNKRIMLEIDGTRIYQPSMPSLTLYKLSHPIDWRSGDDMVEGFTLNKMAQLPYLSEIHSDTAHRICDVQVIGDEAAYDPVDIYPQALIRSPPWGLNPPLMKFFYKGDAKVMGICEAVDPCVEKDKYTHVPSLIMAADVLGMEKKELEPGYDYPNGEYSVRWLQCRGGYTSALEVCGLVLRENGRLKRRYRLSWNANEITKKQDADMLVASWCTRVWMEEVYLKVIESKLYEQRLLADQANDHIQCAKNMGWKAILYALRLSWCGYRGRKRIFHHDCHMC